MKKLRYYWRLTIAFLSRFSGLIFLGAIFGIIIFGVLYSMIPRLDNKTERIGITGRYQTDNIPRYILDMVGDGLVSIDEEGKPIPNLAKSWTVENDNKKWIFTISEDKYWQDGEKVTSSNVVYEFSDVEIERPDDNTIIFNLKDPFAPFATVLSKPTFRKGLLGTDEWRVDDIRIIGNYVSEIRLADDNDNSTIFKFYPTDEQTKLAFKMGHVDKLMDVLEPSPLDAWDTVQTDSNVDQSKVVTLFFNNTDPILSGKSFRQALIYAINKDDLNGERALSSISPSSWAYNPQVKSYSYNQERAKELLSDTPKELLEQPIKIVSSPIMLPTAEKISKHWEEIGVKSIVQVSSVVPEEFQVYLTIFDIPKDPDQYPFWHSTQENTNVSNYSSERIDKLLEDGRTEFDETKRKKIYLDFQRFLVEDSPAAFLFHPEVYTLSRK